MSRTQLHLVDGTGQPVNQPIQVAVEAAFAWAVKSFPNVDTALLAEWAEAVGRSMQERQATIISVRRYAFAAMNGKLREWYRSSASKEIPVGIGPILEEWIGINRATPIEMDRSVLFSQLTTKLNDRDREILVLLRQGITSPTDVGEALDIGYEAASKAIQRVKKRLAAVLAGSQMSDADLGQTSKKRIDTTDEARV